MKNLDKVYSDSKSVTEKVLGKITSGKKYKHRYGKEKTDEEKDEY